MLVLASTSPRRRELLREAGYRFEIEAPRVAEDFEKDTSPDQVVRTLALKKALAVAERRPDDAVLGSDTVVAIDGEILVTPRDRSDAETMLKKLEGSTHTVHTGVALVWRGRTRVEADRTDVKFHPLSTDQILEYISTGEGDDKAGAYAYQGRGRSLVAGVDGDPNTVIGLPVRLVKEMLEEWELSFKE